jgi:hypothetical protein
MSAAPQRPPERMRPSTSSKRDCGGQVSGRAVRDGRAGERRRLTRSVPTNLGQAASPLRHPDTKKTCTDLHQGQLEPVLGGLHVERAHAALAVERGHGAVGGAHDVEGGVEGADDAAVAWGWGGGGGGGRERGDEAESEARGLQWARLGGAAGGGCDQDRAPGASTPPWLLRLQTRREKPPTTPPLPTVGQAVLEVVGRRVDQHAAARPSPPRRPLKKRRKTP